MKKLKIIIVFFGLFFCFNSTFAMQKEENFKKQNNIKENELTEKDIENSELLLTKEQINILNDLNISKLSGNNLKKDFKKNIKKQIEKYKSLENFLKNFMLTLTIVVSKENYNIFLVFRDLEFFKKGEKNYFQFKKTIKTKIERTKKIKTKNIFKFKALQKNKKEEEIFNKVLNEQKNDEFEFSEKQKKEFEKYKKDFCFYQTENQIKELLNFCYLNNHLDGFTIKVENSNEKLELKFILLSTTKKIFKMQAILTIKEKDEFLEMDN